MQFKKFHKIIERWQTALYKKRNKNRIFHINGRRLSVLVLSFFAAWLFTMPFEGKVLYALLDGYHVQAQPFVLGSMAAHCIGLIFCGFFIKTEQSAKRLTLISIVFCFTASAAFFFPPSFLWYAALFSSSFLAGCCVAAWGYFLKSWTLKNERSKTIAEMLAFSYILLLFIVKAATGISAQTGLILSILPLCFMFIFTLRLPVKEHIQGPLKVKPLKNPVSIARPLVFLCLFIMIVAVNVGFMYQVQFPAFSHLKQLTSWYWAVPYIAAILIIRYLPSKVNRSHMLFAAIAMTGLSFIGFMLLDNSPTSYLIVHTLMFGSVGIFNLFWWTILGEMLEFHENPARILGTGLFANVLGILLGELIVNIVAPENVQNYHSLLALAVVCITLVLLPPLYARLAALLKTHEFLTVFCEMPKQEQDRLINISAEAAKLTPREAEIAMLLIKGKTYRMVALELHISENTVRFHVKGIYSKYGVRNRAELINIMMAAKAAPVSNKILNNN